MGTLAALQKAGRRMKLLGVPDLSQFLVSCFQGRGVATRWSRYFTLISILRCGH